MVHPFVYMSLSSYVLLPLVPGFSGGASSSHVDVDVAQVVRRRAADLQRAGGRPHRLLTKALQVSLIIRCDSAAIASNSSELLPEPETPVKAGASGSRR